MVTLSKEYVSLPPESLSHFFITTPPFFVCAALTDLNWQRNFGPDRRRPWQVAVPGILCW